MEAIKSAVQFGLGVAFVSVSAIHKELQLGLAYHVNIKGVHLTRTLHLVSNPRRDYSRAAQKFMATSFEVCGANTSHRINRCEQATAPLQHAQPAARPWEQHLHHQGVLGGRTILQQAQKQQ